MAKSPTFAKNIFQRLTMRRSKKQSTSDNFEINNTEIPLKPCTVLKIRDYIQTDMLKEAYLNLLSMRLKLQKEWEAVGEGAPPTDLVNKQTDASMLLGTLRNKMSVIVRNSSALPSCNKELLVYVTHIILEEEKRQGEPGAMQGWREAWRDAIRDGVQDTLKKVHLDSHEENASWLAVHLGLLGKAVVEDLERVKTELLSSYPEDFNVFETYVSCHREAVGEHLKILLEKVTELKDYYALLDFIVHRYPSDLRDKQRTLIMEEDLLNKIKTLYYHRQMDDFKSALENIIIIEKEVWTMKKTPYRTDDGFLTSETYMDICKLIASYAGNLEKIDENLGKSVVRFCLEELNPFHTRFEEEFSQHTSSLLTSDLLDCCLWVQYHISYINSFNSLKENMQCYKENCSAQVEQLEKQVDELIQRLSQTLINHFKTDVKVFVNGVHYYVAREYVSQLMKKKYSCKKNKNEDAAAKMREQWNELKKLFEDMGSSLNWLYPLGDYLSDIIGMKNEKKIKELLIPLVSNYPDISKKQLSAVLYFRDNSFSLEKHNVINQFTVLKRDGLNTNHDHSFFTDIE
ncbi:exocyst complex component 3-like protein 4 isoform X2 [Ctenopharyngodon idella]|uniref:exocyst complex component 3-like protein 4 isoform X2 n=1 Tax=Ctenopharyngodon idella TaxID=7959 RepID=UPI0022321DAD|nr:exocyst complex component 3-like protein 4 isoform X2 [Ctenopharyngodon idella]